MRGATTIAVLVFTCLWTSGIEGVQQPNKSVPLSAKEVFAKVNSAVVTIVTSTGQGSGVIVDPSGVIATNLHVMRGAKHASVRVPNGDSFDVTGVMAFDHQKDLILVKVPGFGLPTVEFANSDETVTGTKVFAVGTPQGLTSSISEGIVSSVRDSGEGYRVIQTSAAISPGSSGGGLFDEFGRLIGLTTFKLGGGESLNFALPINYVRGMASNTVRFSLTELDAAIQAKAGTTNSDAVTTTANNLSGVPRLSSVYVSTNGNMAIVKQSDGNIEISFTNSGGITYGRLNASWNATQKAFIGSGTVKTVCGVYDTRIWDAPITEEISPMNEGATVIRDRWTQPVRVNCSQGRVTEISWQEMFWYVPTK